MTTKEKQRRAIMATAHHEAAHAVVARWLGLRFKYLTIKPDADAGNVGHMRHRFPKWFRPDIESTDRVRLRRERHIIMSFAGQIAETKFLGRRPRYGMDGDNQNAADMAFSFCGSPETAEAYLEYCFLVSRDLVNLCWREIELLAAALLERQTIKYEDAIQVISPASKSLKVSLESAKAKG